MANVFIHFEPIGPVGEQIDVDEDLRQPLVLQLAAEKQGHAANANGMFTWDHGRLSH